LTGPPPHPPRKGRGGAFPGLFAYHHGGNSPGIVYPRSGGELYPTIATTRGYKTVALMLCTPEWEGRKLHQGVTRPNVGPDGDCRAQARTIPLE